MKKRIMSILLSLYMVVCMMPTTVYADVTGAMQLGASGIAEGNKIYFGTYTDNSTAYDVPWIVLPSGTLSKSSVAEGTDCLPLLSEYSLDISVYRDMSNLGFYNYSTKTQTVDSSVLKTKMEDYYNGTNSLFATDIQRNAIADTSLTEVSSPVEENYLSGQKLFPLSYSEAGNLSLSNRAAKDIKNPTFGSSWWLRSSFSVSSAWAVDSHGSINSRSVTDNHTFVRPALNLDLSSVLFSSAATGGKASNSVGTNALTAVSSTTPTEWKLTLKDSSRNTFAAATTSFYGNELTISYFGATVGTNEYISAIVKDTNGNITYYGRLKNSATTTDANGTATISLSGVTINSTDTLYVFSEQYNGDKKTDYASEFKEVLLSKNAYSITNSLTNITSDNTSTYRLMSDTANYTATLSPDTSYALPATITVKVGGTALAAGTSYTYNNTSGELGIPVANITGDIEITADGVELDRTAPVLTAGAVSRTSDSAATVKFTSNEAGHYYYSVVEEGVTEPTVNTTGTGTACGTTEQTITLNSLVAGAKDIYIVVKDAAGNASSSLKINIPAYVPTTYALTVNLNGGNGGTTSGNYAQNTHIAINAGTKANYNFNGWTSSNGGTFDDASSASTTFTMPGNTTTITANWTYKGGSAPVQLSAPTNLSWNGAGKATWSASANASSYTVQLYKDGVAYGSPKTGIIGTSYNFASAIIESGRYTFTVTAVGDAVNYTDSAQSVQSAVYNYTNSYTSPKTGDHTKSVLWIALSVLSVGGLTALSIIKKHKKTN